MLRAALAGAVLAMPAALPAQALRCEIPPRLSRPHHDGPTGNQQRRVVAIGGYTLAMSWAPQDCAVNGRGADRRLQCGGDNRFGFTLHGLWPDGSGAQWPQYCRPAALLPPAVIRRNLCATPSVQLLQHEWAKHGTCMVREPDAYFARATALYQRVRYPDMRALAARPLTVGRFAAAFAAANPGMGAAMLRVTTDRRGWLEEVWLCLDRQFRFTRCPAHQRGAPPATRLRIRPV
ncbi:ribonuclease T2 family protein [Sphingomonas flavalba]|uniref:ribonuclease T2 family protein n=1 Tax=Sphingomonas flavalba TaxID=2559804 RepID=UPI0039E0E73B